MSGGDWEGVRLHVVTGKGGTGKTTVAAALALALASGGGRTLLAEVEDRQGFAQLLDVPPLGYEERRVAVARGGGEVWGLAVEAKAALAEYLEMFYKIGRGSRVLEKIGAVDFATTVAPGLRDVLLIGKVYEAVKRRAGPRGRQHPVYDAVVLDAPPTGRIGRFLGVNQEVAGLARMGPVKGQAESIMQVLRSPQSVVHLVTILEEMPVQETLDAAGELRAKGLPVGGVVVNQVRTPLLPAGALDDAREGRLDREAVLGGLRSAGLVRGRSAAGEALADGLLAEAAEHSTRVQLEERERIDLASLDRPTYDLPRLTGGIDLGALYELADELTRQGMA